MHLLETGRATLLATCVAIIFQGQLITLVIFLGEIMIDFSGCETFPFVFFSLQSTNKATELIK